MGYDWNNRRATHRSARVNFVRNAWEPIAIPRWTVAVKYALFIVVGLATFITGLPTLSLTTFNGYEPIWAGFVGFGGILGFIGALRPRWGGIEAFGAAILVSFLAVLIVALTSRGSTSVALLLVVVCVVPAVRAVFLFTHYSFRRRGLI